MNKKTIITIISLGTLGSVAAFGVYKYINTLKPKNKKQKNQLNINDIIKQIYNDNYEDHKTQSLPPQEQKENKTISKQQINSERNQNKQVHRVIHIPKKILSDSGMIALLNDIKLNDIKTKNKQSTYLNTKNNQTTNKID